MNHEEVRTQALFSVMMTGASALLLVAFGVLGLAFLGGSSFANLFFSLALAAGTLLWGWSLLDLIALNRNKLLVVAHAATALVAGSAAVLTYLN